jgi:ribosomal protein S6E (S10)
MKKTMSGTLMSVLVVLMMLVSVAQPVLNMNDKASLENMDGSATADNVDNTIGIDSGDANSPAKSKSYSKVIVATNDVAKLAIYLSKYDYVGIIGAQPSNRRGVAFPVLSVPPSAIEGIAALPDVLGVYDYVDPVSPSGTDGTAFSRSLLEMDPNSVITDSLNIEGGSLYHGAEEAWGNGFTGEGVKIATITSGTDFGHPELAGRQATITNASSPYYGYPIAYDPTSMSSFVDTGLQASTLDPSDSWYVNTSSTDLNIYHTVVVDGINDFWTEFNRHNSSQSVYPMRLTNESRTTDKAEDISAFELDLKGLYVTSDRDNWYMGFDVAPVSDTWKRSFDVNYGMYIDTDNIAGSGARTDPKGNLIAPSSANRPEYAIYFHHVGVDWGVGTDGKVWSNNNTVQNATFYSWFNNSWREVTMTEDLPYNATVGIEPTAGSHITTTTDGQSFVSHNGIDYRLNSNNTIYYNQSGYRYVSLKMIKGVQKFTTNFVEFSMPKTMMANAQFFSTVLFTTGNNISHAQDTVPSSAGVNFNDPAWDAGTTTLVDYTFINAPPQYVVTGIPSASGNYRIGLHPDQNLNLQYGRPVAVLLTDSYEAGKYDAIYVDLDNDKDFRDEIPMMGYGAYNESMMIGPRWGTERYENNTIKHDNKWYTMKDYSIESSTETLTSSAVGGETIFYVGNTSVDPPSVSIQRTAQHTLSFNNDSVVYTFVDDTVPWSFFLPHGNIVNYTFMIIHSWDGANRYFEDLSLYPGVSVNNLTGEVTFTDALNWDNANSSWGATEIYAWFEYSVAVDTGFTFDQITGKITLDEPLMTGDFLNVTYSYTAEIDITPAHRYGKILYNSNIVELELRDWISNRDIDSDKIYWPAAWDKKDAKVKGDGKFYPDLSGGMAYFIAQETDIADEVLEGKGTAYHFANKYVTEGSVTLYQNGIALGDLGDKNATINYLDGKIDFLFTPAGTDVITADYSYRIPVPYMDMYWEWNGIENEKRKLPGNGDMIALFGEFPEASAQGTEVGTAISGLGTLKDGNNNALVKGMAPGAKLISIRGGAFASWYFAVEGYDGIVGTDDDAQIVALTSTFPVSNSGWDVYTKGAEYIGKYYAEGKVLFVAGTGDAGFGYGTAQSPGSSETTITAGQGTMFNYRNYKPKAPTALARAYADGGSNPAHGDVLSSSGRGPNMLGNPEPDVITIGAFQFGGTPLNIDQAATTTDFEWYGGQWAWELWSGPAVSAANTAGILALIYDAYYKAEHKVTREVILENSSSNTTIKKLPLSHSPVIGGTVTIWINNAIVTNYNVDLTTGIVNFTSNVSITKGDWINASYTFTNEFPDTVEARSLLRSGADNMNYDILTQGSGFSNADRSTKLANELDGIYLDKTYWVPGDYRGIRYEGFVKLMEPGDSASETVTITNKNPTDAASIQIYDSIYHKFGEYKIDMNITRTYDDPTTPGIMNIEPFVAVGTELLKVTATSPRKSTMQTYMAELFDWTDANQNGLVNFPSEQNRMTYVIGTNSLELRYRDPIGRTTDGLVVQVKGFGGAGEALNDWVITLEFFQKVDWSWLTLSGAPTTLLAGASSTFSMNLNIPNYADVGSYEGAVYINRKAPVDTVASGVGILMENVPFGWWDQTPSADFPESFARPADNEVGSGNRSIVPLSTKIFWNGTALYEGVDYELDGTSGVHFFKAINNFTQTLVPWDAAYLNMTYLTVLTGGTGTWSGQMNISNIATGSYIFKKNGVVWDESESLNGENVLTATGGELRASLSNRNVIRNTVKLYRDGMTWPQDGGQVMEPTTAVGGENSIQLSHGNIVPGTTTLSINSVVKSQTGEVSLIKKELVQGLDSTASWENTTFNDAFGPDMDGSVWNAAGIWYAQIPNALGTDHFRIVTYLVFEDGIPLTDGLDFTMLSMPDNSTRKIQFANNIDPSSHAYSVQYTYYDNSFQVGQLAHALVISESYKLYKNGAALKTTDFFLELETGIITLATPLGPNEIVEAAYQYNVYLVDTRMGLIILANSLLAGDTIEATYEYYTYTLDLQTGVLEFANPLTSGVVITADYSFGRYTMDLVKGIVKFASPLLPGENVTCEYYYYSNVIPIFFNIGADKPDFSFGGPDSTPYTFDITAGTDAAGNPLVMGAAPNPWTFTIGDLTAPTITKTAPANGATDVTLASSIVVTFSEAMNPGSVTYTCVPAVTGWSVVWSAGNTVATYSHTGAFVENTLYMFQITAGTDAAGHPLEDGAIPGSWTFSTTFTAPFITISVPADGATGVALTSDVVVTFSEAMNTGSVTYSCTPDPTGWSVVWSVGNTVATYSHTNDFVENTDYTFEITTGDDVNGIALAAGTVPNPWSFTTLLLSPAVTNTIPADGAKDIALTADVIVTFSEAMNTGSVTYTCTPDPTGWSVVWSAGDTVATYSHSVAFDENTVYTFQITAGTDAGGTPLIAGAVPNPWTFTSTGAPTITNTVPANGATGVALTADIVVTFSEPMNTGSIFIDCTPGPTAWSLVWSAGDTVATYSHAEAFEENTIYTIQILLGTDVVGNPVIAGGIPNPWTFTTLGAPTITSTVPANGATGVALTAPVVVTFSEAMNTSSVKYTSTPDPTGWSFVWSAGNTVVTYRYTGGFYENTVYTFQITAGTDIAGNALIAGAAPNPWTFTTPGAPRITNTVPANGTASVALISPVVVTFSEAMNTGSVTYTCVPAVTGWSVVWSGGNTIATYSHTSPYTENTLYIFTITAGTDLTGNALVPLTPPNPWTFTTVGVSPMITATSPVDGATGVAVTATVVVTFSEAMNTSSVTFTCTPDPTGWSVVWSAGNTVATFSHLIAFTESMSLSEAKFAYDDLFRYNEIRGGYGNEGDWRYVFMDIKEQGKYALPTPNERLLVDVAWENDKSDVDVQVFGGRESQPAWAYEAFPEEQYGPHSIGFVGGSDETADFFTTTGGPEEISAPKISPGLNVIGLHTVGLNGSTDCTETFSAKVGTMYIDSTEIKVVTNQLVGEATLNMESSMEWSGVGGIAAGPSAPEKLKNCTVVQDDPDWTKFDTFQDQLASGKTVYSRTIQDCLIFNVHIWGQATAVDLDLGVFLDGSGTPSKKDGVVQVDEYVAMCADSDADEEVKLIAPKDGTYLIVIFGFTLATNPALFDMDITIVQGTGFDVQGKGINSLPADQKGYFASNQTEEPFNQTNLKLKWDLPGSATGSLQGALYVGPGNGPMCMLVPIELTIDTTPPVITSPTPIENSYIMTRRPNIAISLADSVRGELVASTMKLYLDGNDVTTQSTVSIPFLNADTDPVKGYPAGTATYVPTSALIDGAHVVKAVIKDKAGNEAVKEWGFTVDSNAPYFEITNPRGEISYTNAASIDITGFTEYGLEPKAIGATPSASSMSEDGAFVITLPLTIGENTFILQTTDLAGNSKQLMGTIFRDTVLPEFTSVRFSTGFTTNKPNTLLEGKMSEAGTMVVNGEIVPVNADGSFEQMLGLSEGRNTFHLEFTDRAGNIRHSWQNVTLDTVAPTLSIVAGESIVDSPSFILAGSVEAGSELFVNGKRIDVGTRQSTGDFNTTLTLSYGLNTIVIEAQDSAGNIAEIRHIVEYDAKAGDANYAAIGLMVVLLILGLILGIFLAPFLPNILGGKKEEQPEEVEPVADAPEEVSPEMQEPETPGEIESDESLESKPETDTLEPIPTEESIPEELPEEVAPVEAESEEIPPAAPVSAESEDPRIAKLTEAYKSGKISKELYEKNLARFKNQ